VLDIETTGLSPKENEITEVAAIKVKNGNIISEFQSLIKIKNSVPTHITALTGITDEMLLKDGRNPHDVFNELDEFIGDSVVVGHNVVFDINFLYQSYQYHLNKAFSNDYVDTMKLSKTLVKDCLNYKLKTLCEVFKIH